MPATSDLLVDNLPRSGWSSSWGLEGMPRPGCMPGTYWLQTTGATGHAVLLNKGTFLFYNNEGTIAGVSYAGFNNLLFSTIVLRANFSTDFGDPLKLSINMIFGLWFEDETPCEWSKAYVDLDWPTARQAFQLPAAGDSPCPFFPASIPNPLILTPLTDYAVSIWRFDGP